MVKGNNGRAARRRIWYKVLAGLCFLLGMLVVFTIIFVIAMGTVRGHDENVPQQLTAEQRHRRFRKRWRQQQIEKQKHGGEERPDASDKEVVLKQILEGHLHLIDLAPNLEKIRLLQRQRPYQNNNSDFDYGGMFRGKFCHLNWSWHEQDPSLSPMFRPSLSPMFRDVLTYSNCDVVGGDEDGVHFMDLYQVVQAAQLYDHNLRLQQEGTDYDPVLKLSGVVFHESRCGSTLIANLMQLHNPQENIVYSESAPPIAILRLARENFLDPDGLAVPLLQHVIYLMSRGYATPKRRVFFKIQSIGTLGGLELFRRAFPDMPPWIFVFRDPVEVMMSQLEAGKQSNCVRSKYSSDGPPPDIVRVVQKYRPNQSLRSSSSSTVRNLNLEDYCAAHLAALTEEVVRVLALSSANNNNNDGKNGLVVQYHDLPAIFVNVILPKVWNIPVDDAARERLERGGKTYSKARGQHKMGQEFVSDSQSKQQHASAAVQRAAKIFLMPSYQQLQLFAEQIKLDLGHEVIIVHDPNPVPLEPIQLAQL